MEKKCWLISVNMGYGHQRTAFPLRHLALDEMIINANDYHKMPGEDKKAWKAIKDFYEFVSNVKRIPLFGDLIFLIFDFFQKIFNFYPKRDLSRPNFQLKETYEMIKGGWGRDLIEKLKKRNEKIGKTLPLVSTFFVPAFMAEFFRYPGDIFCVVCDADVSRSWAPFYPKESKIKYFAPTQRVAERLKLYGIDQRNIFFTGYPLPKELIGAEQMEELKENLKHRLLNLDPQKKYFQRYQELVVSKLGPVPSVSDHPLTILFSIGGAGAQKEQAIAYLRSLFFYLKKGELRIILSAGVKEKVNNYFLKSIEKLGLEERLGKEIEIIFSSSVKGYFEKFNQALKKTDILWTKPSELSFYSALGIPILIAPPIGSQEQSNMRWLLKSGFALKQENPAYARQWLFDWLREGYFAEAAMEAFIEGEKLGTFNIEKIIPAPSPLENGF